ncbi:MAG: hypothetical protein JWO95_2946 [Verrucomicrobiales bacterium]|nr:hypothetical protein [Verrucomicrobiales bacterium]
MTARRLIALICTFVLTLTFTSTAATKYNDAFPSAASKKGLQVDMIDDALALGVKHGALNFDLARLIDPAGDTNNPSYELNGKLFHFRRDYLQAMYSRIKALSDHGILVYIIVLAYTSPDPQVNRILHHPHSIENPPNGLAAFNTVTDEGRAWFQASMEFIAERWARTDQQFGRAIGYIIGNEVNSHWEWNNMGKVTMEQFADDYLRTVRLANTAVRKQSASARVYLSLEHHWNIHYPPLTEEQSFPARPFLEYFARRAREGGDFDWHLAFHPYPENLFEPRFWNDKSATTSTNTPRITFKNLEMLTQFMNQPNLRYYGKPRSIILSEQGFHTPDGPDGEKIQAAAYCYAYKKVESLKGIDAFILHRHVDNANEGGLMLGLRGMTPARGEQHPRKLIYECFRTADTPDWKETFRFALPIIGLKDWKSLTSQNHVIPPKLH